MSEPWRLGLPRSSQCGGGDTGPPTVPRATTSGGTLLMSNSALSSSVCFCAAASLAVNSVSVNSLRVPSESARTRGTPTKSVPGHTPCRSGSPHGVRGGVQVFPVDAFFKGDSLAGELWPAHETETTNANPTVAAIRTAHRCPIFIRDLDRPLYGRDLSGAAECMIDGRFHRLG